MRPAEWSTPGWWSPLPGAVLEFRDAATAAVTQRTLDGGGACDQEFGAAAEAALREVRFTPARRDGQSVPFEMRLTIVFTP